MSENLRQWERNGVAICVYRNGRMEWQANFIRPNRLSGDDLVQYPLNPQIADLDTACEHADALLDSGRIFHPTNSTGAVKP